MQENEVLLYTAYKVRTAMDLMCSALYMLKNSMNIKFFAKSNSIRGKRRRSTLHQINKNKNNRNFIFFPEHKRKKRDREHFKVQRETPKPSQTNIDWRKKRISVEMIFETHDETKGNPAKEK